MTISLKKVTAGSSYYLTRQVAAQDGMVRTGLAVYYEKRRGARSLDGLRSGRAGWRRSWRPRSPRRR